LSLLLHSVAVLDRDWWSFVESQYQTSCEIWRKPRG